MFFLTACGVEERDSLLLDDKRFSLAELAKTIDYSIKSRESYDKRDIHRVYLRVEVHQELSRREFLALAEWIVKKTVMKERCHSITLDFGFLGNVDFAPYGNLIMAGAVPIDSYNNYAFKYYFNRETEKYRTEK
ncbi:MAG: hypothetical protein JXB26_04825 [Candidatus Aminicenantes bacterium]|nr:hypothetical protein [Candidatus Aminicenantes bacterium]